MNCNKIMKTKECANRINKINHEGTLLSFDAIESYTIKWIEIMKNMQYTKLTFIDCMASSGIYYSEIDDSITSGTVMRVINIFKRYARKNPNISFEIFLNELNPKYVECLECLKTNYICSDLDNLTIEIEKGDRYDFIDKYYNLQLIDYSKKHHTLFLFDPYEVEFKWESLKKLFNYKNSDVIFTHFFPNDAKRNITNPKTSKEKKQDIILSYKSDLDELEDVMKLQNVKEKNIFFRDRLNDIIENVSDTKKYISYSPVFNNRQKTHVYDILCISRSTVATAILKNTMFKMYNDIKETEEKPEDTQLNLFDSIGETRADYDINKVNEYKFRYDKEIVIQQFIEKFNGRKLSKSSLVKELELDPFLPSVGILSIVKKSFKYEIIKENNTRYYCFPSVGEKK